MILNRFLDVNIVLIWKKNDCIELKNLKTGKTTKCVKADKNGYFKLKKLNLKKWGGAKVQVNLYKYSKEQKRNVQVVCNTVLKVKKK